MGWKLRWPRRKRPAPRFCTKTLLCRLADGHNNGCERI